MLYQAASSVGIFASTFPLAAGIWVDNIAVYSASVPANSPTINLGGTYWNAAGNASATDTWTLQNVTESAPSTPPILAITHAGSTDAAALVQVPNLQPVGNIVMGTTAITFGATYPIPDLGLSRFTGTAGRLAVGAGAAGDYSGVIACASILGPITPNGTDWAWDLNTAGVHINSTLPLNWGSSVATAAVDSGISRLGAASLAIGNGTAGDTTGNLSFNKVIKYAGVATVSAGVPSELATVDLTAQSAAITATTLYAVPAAGAGMYLITWVAKITTKDAAASTLGGTNGFQVSYTSPTDSVVGTDSPTTPVISAANTTGTSISGSEVVYAKASTNIQYAFGYTSTTPGQMVYELHIKCSYLG